MNASLSSTGSLTESTSYPRALQLRNAAHIASVTCLVALICAPTVLGLIQTWNDFESLSQSHGWLIAACIFWIIYESAATGPLVRMSPSIRRASTVAVVSLVWLVAIAANVQIVHQVMLPILCCAFVYALYGWPIVRHYVFAFAYLYFAMAIWSLFSPPLQWATIYAMRVMVRVVGIPAFFEETFIELPSGLLVVEGGCSGLNFFVVALALASLYAYLNKVRRWWALLALGAALAIFANWVRVLTIVIAGHVTNMQHYLVRVEHIRFGWVVFAVMMVIFFFVANRMETSAEQPLLRSDNSGSNDVSKVAITMVVAALLLGPAWYWLSQMRVDTRAIAQLAAPADWTLAPAAAQWTPVFEEADLRQTLSWYRGDQTVETFQAIYRRQTQDGKLAGWRNTILGESLQPVMEQAPHIERANLSSMLAIDVSGERWLIWQRYTAGDAVFASARRAQITAGLRSLIIPTAATVEAWRAPCRPDCAAAAQLLDRFVSMD